MVKIQDLQRFDEASLSRTYRLLLEQDGGIITASRYARECGTGQPYTREENVQRNRSLLSKLRQRGFGVTGARGSYIENYGTDQAIEVGEDVFIVIDIRGRGFLRNSLIALGEEFEQDSVLYVPKPGDRGMLIGTNQCPGGYPGYRKTVMLKNPVFGKEGEFMTRIQGRPFVLSEGTQYLAPAMGFFGKWGESLLANKNWEDIDDTSVLDKPDGRDT